MGGSQRVGRMGSQHRMPTMSEILDRAADAVSSATTPTYGNFIAGEWSTPSRAAAPSRAATRPTRATSSGASRPATAADVAMAIRAAETAFPAWRATPAPKRGEILYRFGALMAEHKERLARAHDPRDGQGPRRGPRRRPGGRSTSPT